MKTVEEFGIKDMITAESDIAAMRNFLSEYVRNDLIHVLGFTKIFQLQGRNTSHMNSDDDVSTLNLKFSFMSKFYFSWRYTALVT